MAKEFANVHGGTQTMIDDVMHFTGATITTWSGTFAEFKEEFEKVTVRGFVSPDFECTWEACDDERVLKVAQAMEKLDGHVGWAQEDDESEKLVGVRLIVG